MKEIEVYFLLFIIYACIGWILEVLCKIITQRKFVNRGFLIGPYLPIYGFGSILMTFMLTKYKGDLVTLFGMAVLWCSFLEYITSYVMEKLFKARWWDYSTNPFNVNGRICLVNAIFFGIGGVCIIQYTNPIIIPFLENLPNSFRHILSIILFCTYFLDTIISCNIITKFSKTAHFVLQDRSEEISKLVKKKTKMMKESVIIEISNKLKKLQKETNIQLKKLYQSKNIFHRRLLDAFPNVEIRNEKIEKKIRYFIRKIRKERD